MSADGKLRVQTFGSGSSGNCTLLQFGGKAMLVDAGLTMQTIEERLQLQQIAPASLAGIVVTHAHGDHLGCAAKFSRHHKTNIYVSEGAAAANGPLRRLKRLVRFTPGDSFDVAGFRIFTIPIFHDAVGTVACVVAAGNAQFGIATDLGRENGAVAQALSRCDGFILEFNHDERALRDGIYPWRLKRRVLSEEGHLSNDQAAALLLKCVSTRTKQVLLAHLSDKNNDLETALASARRSLQISGNTQIALHVAPRSEAGPIFEYF